MTTDFAIKTNKNLDYFKALTKIDLKDNVCCNKEILKELALELLPERIRKLKQDFCSNQQYIQFLSNSTNIDIINLNDLEDYQLDCLLHPELYRECCAIIVSFILLTNKGQIDEEGMLFVQHCSNVYGELKNILECKKASNINKPECVNQKCIEDLFPSKETMSKIVQNFSKEDIDELTLILKDKLYTDYKMMAG